MSKLPDDLTISRTTRVKVPKSIRPPRVAFAVCVKHDDERLLITGKVYKVTIVNGLAAVIDEEGEAAVYPLDYFLVLSLSQRTKDALAEVVG